MHNKSEQLRSKDSFQLYDQEVTIDNIQLSCLFGMILMPAGIILDFFRYPDRLGFFLDLRLGCSALFGLFWLFVRSSAGRKNYLTMGVLLAVLPAFFTAWMIFATDGAMSPYYAGLNLVLLVVGLILHWTFRESFIATIAVLGMYLLACYGNSATFLSDSQVRGEFANNVYYLVLTGIIVVAGSGYHFRLRFREYALLFTLDAIKNPREGDQIAGAANSNTEAVPASPQHLCSISKIERFSFFLLRSFRWFCGKENRSTLEIVEADLLRDRKEMLDDRCRRTFIALVIAWKALASMAGICLDSLAESARALNPIKNLLR